MSADYQVHGDVAVITLNNPPVNGLGMATRRGIVEGLEKAQADDKVKAIVITGAGGAFSGGADITEFGTDKALAEPNLHSVISAVEQSAKPVVAAIHSVCMGGGLELALACHYRVAAPGCNVALPEVKLGLLPGAGGTQRLPRVLGVEAALNMIVSGEPVKSEFIASVPGQKLFDKLVDSPEGLAEGALSFARGVADVRPLPLVRDLPCKHPNAEAYFQFARNMVKGMAKNFPRAGQVRRCGGGRRQEQEVRRWPEGRARAVPAADVDAGIALAASPVLRRARGQQDSRRAG